MDGVGRVLYLVTLYASMLLVNKSEFNNAVSICDSGAINVFHFLKSCNKNIEHRSCHFDSLSISFNGNRHF